MDQLLTLNSKVSFVFLGFYMYNGEENEYEEGVEPKLEFFMTIKI